MTPAPALQGEITGSRQTEGQVSRPSGGPLGAEFLLLPQGRRLKEQQEVAAAVIQRCYRKYKQVRAQTREGACVHTRTPLPPLCPEHPSAAEALIALLFPQADLDCA